METLVVEAAPVNLRSDNVAGIAPEILAAIEAANAGTAPSYGADPITARLQDVFSELFETRCFVQPVATGTATNALALALIAPPYGAVYCTAVGHVHDSECGAGEFYTGGAKIVPLAEEHGRLQPETLRAALRKAGVGHTGRVQPAALNLTQATERGTVYGLDELDALVEVARSYGLPRAHGRRAFCQRHRRARLPPGGRDLAARRRRAVVRRDQERRDGRRGGRRVHRRSGRAVALSGAARGPGVLQDALHLGAARGLRAGRAVAAPRRPRQRHGAPPRRRASPDCPACVWCIRSRSTRSSRRCRGR